MDIFRTHHADILNPAQQPRVVALLRQHGLVTFTGITERAALASAASTMMSIRTHRDAGPDGVTVVTDTQATASGYAAFSDAELIPHTDGTSLPEPPGLLLLACQQPATQGGDTLLADASRITATLARQHPDTLRALSAPRAARFGTADGYLGPVIEPTGPGRLGIRLRLDDLATFSADTDRALPTLRAVITQHMKTIHLRTGEGILVSNTRWLHGRDRYSGPRVMLRVLGDPLPGSGILTEFPAA
jgi:alpha-ketoglutarate-dependent taurine dioxygenase